MVYAVVRAGGRQEKVEVGSIITVDRLSAQAKKSLTLAPVLYVDGDKVTHDKAELAKITVSAEVVEDLRGPKIVIQKYKNKTGTHDKAELAKITVSAEVIEDLRGPKIVIQKYKNKTGYKARQGFRADLTKLKVTGITKK